MTDELDLTMPAYVDWPLFPFEGDLRLKQPTFRDADPPRSGEPGGSECASCREGDTGAIWVDEHWKVRPQQQPAGVPALLFLETRAHVDMDGLSSERAAEMGQLIVRLDRAIQAIGNIGRVHVNRWGDGGAHFHMWFFARPVGWFSLLGFGMPFWEPAMPRVDQELWDANLRIVAAELAKDGGAALV
jgi:hypothetical protein